LWDNINEPITQDRDFWPRSYGVAIRQPIFEGFGTVAATEQAEHLVRAGRFRLLDTEQLLLLDAITTYMAAVRDEAVLELNINNEKVLAAQFEATRDRFDAEEPTRTDVAQSEARLQGATASRIQAERQPTASRAAYRHAEALDHDALKDRTIVGTLDLPDVVIESILGISLEASITVTNSSLRPVCGTLPNLWDRVSAGTGAEGPSVATFVLPG
jgi:outer membrane protein